MKKLLTIFVTNLLIFGGIALNADAQMMPDPQSVESSRSGMRGLRVSDINWNEVVEHTLREEKEGKELWEKLQAKQAKCADFSDHDFGTLGEYFMGVMTGDSHAAMNAMMAQMHGEEGEEQIHIVMGKRLSGCDTSAAVPDIGGGWMPMMQTMWGGFNNMMNFGALGFFGWFFMLLWWALIAVAIAVLVKWLANQFKDGGSQRKSALDVLKERYAKGEIDKKEFEEKKRDLS